jgi:hypothetical protein
MRALQGLAPAATLGACAGIGADPRRAVQAWLGPTTPADVPAADAMASGRQVARSIWGVVPVPPRRKADLRPEMIAGSAIAVADDALLANCAVVEGRASVGLVRHNKYRIARVEGDRQNAVCRLVVERGPLTPVAGWRGFGDLRGRRERRWDVPRQRSCRRRWPGDGRRREHRPDGRRREGPAGPRRRG